MYGWATVRSDARSLSDIDEVVFENAKKGIDAVIKSTVAFHGLEDKRFIITNVFGTAHAYVPNVPHSCQLGSTDWTIGNGATLSRSLLLITIHSWGVLSTKVSCDSSLGKRSAGSRLWPRTLAAWLLTFASSKAWRKDCPILPSSSGSLRRPHTSQARGRDKYNTPVAPHFRQHPVTALGKWLARPIVFWYKLFRRRDFYGASMCCTVSAADAIHYK